MEHLDNFDPFVEYMFRMLGKDIIKDVEMICYGFEEVKKMNVMIAEIHEKMWTMRLRVWHYDIVLIMAKL
jgi:hypothetical protein